MPVKAAELAFCTVFDDGSFRAINLQLAPFGFPKPLAVINEDRFPNLEANPNFIRQLGLWRVCELAGQSDRLTGSS